MTVQEEENIITSKSKIEINTELVLNDYEKELTKSYVRKIDIRILPIVVIMYIASSLDRGNIGVALKNGLVESLKLSPSEQANVTSLFTLCYIAFEAPANMLLKRLRPRIWFTFIVCAWSLCCMYLAIAKSAIDFTIARCLLGVFEAGFTPGIVAFLPYWYVKSEIGLRMSIFFTALPIAGIIGGPVGASLVQVKSSILKPYQVVFLTEGSITLFLGICVYFLFYDYPDTFKHFTPEEREVALRRITASQGLASKSKITRKQTIAAFMDWKVYAFGIVGFGPNNCLVIFGYFGPTIITGMGYSPTTATYMSGIPYCFGLIGSFISSYYINRVQIYKIYLISTPLNIIGYSCAAFTRINALRMAGLCLSNFATCLSVAYVATWMSVNCGSVSKRMVSTAILLTFTGLAGFVTPYMFTTKQQPDYVLGNTFNIVMLCLTFITTIILKVYFERQNKYRDENPVDVSHLSEQEQQDLNDQHPNFRYRL
ncbi:putative transporter [Smittium culicis]|uniref:Putative transporter n=2 Tax=Smittium culicis TaxID=133412 RepID=A0A1R1X080_9FUNG|nr:putative transporter [Smittium culicis]